MTTQPAVVHYDIAIVGGSHAGLALALALTHLGGPELRVAVIERADVRNQAAANDPRAFAISAGSRNLLAAIGAWPMLEPSAEPVRTIEITDSALTHAVRPVLLTYDNHLTGQTPATYIVEAEALRRALLGRVMETRSVDIIAPAEVRAFESGTCGVMFDLGTRNRISATLLVAADGAKSPTRVAAGIKTLTWSTAQVGLVTTVAHDRPHEGRAVQHFLPAGPFAMLPLPGNRMCVTWTEGAERGRAIAAFDDARFQTEVEQRFGFKLGSIRVDGTRALWPLEFHLARALVAPHIALVGDAVRSVHPLAGQGLNLGFRDVAALAEIVVDGMRLGLSPADGTLLARYEQWRRVDSNSAAAAFGALNQLFSNDSTLLRAARGLGLGLVDRLPGLKATLVNDAAGLSGEIPRLMQPDAS